MPTAALATTRAAQHAGLVRQVHAAKTWLKLDDGAEWPAHLQINVGQ